MACSVYVRVLIVALASLVLAGSAGARSQLSRAQPDNSFQNNQQPTVVTLRWGARPGVARYRLQLAKDSVFADIAFDRVVAGNEYRISDLPAGKYFWRVAPLTAKRGEFSSAGVIEIRDNAIPDGPRIDPSKIQPRAGAIDTGGGWFAAIGNVSRPVLARLRSPNTPDIVAVAGDGRAFALDAASGVALWTTPPRTRRTNGVTSGALAVAPLVMRTTAGLDNVLVFSSNVAAMLEGRTGGEIWRTTLAGVASSALAVNSRIFIVDNSLQKMFVIEGKDGKVLTQIQLPRRAAGPPAPLDFQATRAVVIALDDGGLEIFDQMGKRIGSGDAGSPATTAPLFVRSSHGALLLIGTRNGLTALSAGDLRPLGRVTLKDDVPRGTMSAQDLDGDGVAEVAMFTERGRVVVIKADEGKILWEAEASHAGAVAFADINADRVFDLLMAGREGFAFALSGRDGTIVWKEDGVSNVVANHAPATLSRSPLIVPAGAGVLLIAGDLLRGGLRAVQFPKAKAAVIQ